MSRLDGLADNRLVADLVAIRRDLDELKNRQRVSGRSGILAYQSQTANEWDATFNVSLPPLPTPPGVEQAEYEITFTADGSQEWPLANALVDYESTLTGADEPEFQIIIGNPWLVRSEQEDPLVIKWRMLVYVGANFGGTRPTITGTVRLKAYCVGSCRGTVTVVRTL